MRAAENRKPSPPGRLPVVRVNGVAYFIDMRLRQLRQVDDPHNVIELDGEGSIEADNDDGDEVA